MARRATILSLVTSLALTLSAAGFEELLVTEGETARILCQATVAQELSEVVWTKDEQEQVGRGLIRRDEQRLTVSLILSQVTPEDVGLYSCSMPYTGTRSTYLFVKSSTNLLVPVPPERKLINVFPRQPSVIPCRPTQPGILLGLHDGITLEPINLEAASISYDLTKGFIIHEGNLRHHNGIMKCEASFGNRKEEATFPLVFRLNNGFQLPVPTIDTNDTDWFVGTEMQLHCHINIPSQKVNQVFVSWRIPPLVDVESLEEQYAIQNGRVTVSKSVRPASQSGYSIVQTLLRIDPVSHGDQGQYICEAKVEDKVTYSVEQIRIYDQERLVQFDLSAFNPNVTASPGESIKWVIGIHTTIKPKISWLGPNGNEIQEDRPKFSVMFDSQNDNLLCFINDVTSDDMGKYTLTIFNAQDPKGPPCEQLEMSLFVKDKPRVTFDAEVPFIITPYQNFNFPCNIRSFPPADETTIDLLKCDDESLQCSRADLSSRGSVSMNQTDFVTHIATFTISSFDLKIGELKCQACNKIGCDSASTYVVAGETENAIDIQKLVQTQGATKTVTLTCQATRVLFESVTWDRKVGDTFEHVWGPGYEVQDDIEVSNDSLSTWTNLTFSRFQEEDNGLYRCRGIQMSPPTIFEGRYERISTFQLDEEEPSKPIIVGQNFKNDTVKTVKRGEEVVLSCLVKGIPTPTLSWYKNNAERITSVSKKWRVSNDGTRLTLDATMKHAGLYTCKATNELGKAFSQVELRVTKGGNQTAWIIGGVVIAFLALGMGVYAAFVLKRREQALMTTKEVDYLKNGDQKLLEDCNETLIGEGEKALLLPYDKKLEFPYEKLDMGSQIGVGEFGRVLKAQARGIVSGEKVTTVAIKTLKFPAGHEHLRVLMSELKILAHIGKHPNLLNLLGACTERLKYRELYVILEYCHLGNLQQILIKSRRDFRPGVMTQSKSLGKPVSPKFSPQEKERFFLEPQVSFHDGTSGYISMNGDLRSGIDEDFLTMGDLFIWALHVAKGMNYLASKRVLHGDLACRNILVSEDGTAKISDFGLAKNIYSSKVYVKQSNAPVPVKWLAPESIQDHVFTTQSDVWSYGVTLWEMFSLGMTPYPGIESGPKLFDHVLSGKRMKCPAHAPGYIYDIMLKCWERQPEDRITFDRIVHLLIREIRMSGSFSGNLSPGFSSVAQTQSFDSAFENRTYECPTVKPPSQLIVMPKTEEDEQGYLNPI